MENASIIFRVIAVLVLGLMTAASPCCADTYVFDPKHTEVRFSYYTMGIVQQTGRFTCVDGAMEFDNRSPERAHVEAIIKTASLVTGEPLIEEELKSSNFFNVAVEPEIRFKSHTIRMTGPDTAEMTGEITINGVTKPVTLQVSFRPPDKLALKRELGAREFIATTRIKRSAFNMRAHAFLVSDEVDIEIDAILHKQG